MPGNDILISTKCLTKTFEGIIALDRIDISVKHGSIHGLIGPNGAGKTTFFNVITGLLSATEGKIFYKLTDITNFKPEKITKNGISRTFQAGRLIGGMTVLENVLVGAHPNSHLDLIGTFFRLPFTISKQEKKLKERSMELLDLVGMSRSVNKGAEDLVWVERQLVQIARAIAAEPELLLLDEPTGGMGEEESYRIAEIIKKVRSDRRITVILVAHDMKLVLGISDRITCMNFGRVIFEGSPVEVQNDQNVLEAYLGKE